MESVVLQGRQLIIPLAQGVLGGRVVELHSWKHRDFTQTSFSVHSAVDWQDLVIGSIVVLNCDSLSLGVAVIDSSVARSISPCTVAAVVVRSMVEVGMFVRSFP